MTLVLFFTLALNLLWLTIPENNAEHTKDRLNKTYRGHSRDTLEATCALETTCALQTSCTLDATCCPSPSLDTIQLTPSLRRWTCIEKITIIMTLVLFFTLALNLLWLTIPENNAEHTKDRLNKTFRSSLKTNYTAPIVPSHEGQLEEKTQENRAIDGESLNVTWEIQTNNLPLSQTADQVTQSVLSSGSETVMRTRANSEPFLRENVTSDPHSGVTTDKSSDFIKQNSMMGKERKNSHLSLANNPRAPWGHWGPCSVTCGTGAQERSRKCGPNCQEVESRECYLNSCHGILSGMEFSDKDRESQWTPSLRNHSKMEDQSFLDTDIDACTMWSTCKDDYLQRYMSQLTDLPHCPCYLPFNLHRDNNVWDDASKRFFQWVQVNATEEKLSVYKPGAYKCVRSLLFPGASTLASQICCYSFNLKLITRGRNAGTVNLISPQISWELHYKIDILPWVICKGDWTRYNRVLPPNNMLGCHENPNDEILWEEIRLAREY